MDMLDILTYVPARRKASASGWISFDAPCCVHNGTSADRRSRGGIKVSDRGWGYHCFNCGYTANFIQGRTLSFKSRRLLSWLGVPQEEIERANLESLRHRDVQGILDDRQRTANESQSIRFEERDLPPGAELLTPEHEAEWHYARRRAVPADYPLMTVRFGYVKKNDGVHWTRPQVIVPFTYDNVIVGYSSRMLDDRTPKYIHDIQPGYVFGTDLQRPTWKHVIVTEGVFDALSVSGLAVLHADISDTQARLIRSLDRAITVVPDQDEAGLRLVDRAIELGWAVSMPDWPSDVKDVNDAVVRWGQLATVLTIMQARETSRIKIELRRRQLAQRLRS
jgi:hypothetical protein